MVYFLFLFYSKKLMCVSISITNLFLINKFIRHNQVNDLYYDIKYPDLYLFLSFFNFIFIYY